MALVPFKRSKGAKPKVQDRSQQMPKRMRAGAQGDQEDTAVGRAPREVAPVNGLAQGHDGGRGTYPRSAPLREGRRV